MKDTNRIIPSKRPSRPAAATAPRRAIVGVVAVSALEDEETSVDGEAVNTAMFNQVYRRAGGVLALGAVLLLLSGGASVVHGGTRLGGARSHQTAFTCPPGAVFLALESQVRGYPAVANGPTLPCQILSGPRTQLSSARSLAVSRPGRLHVVQFLTNGTYAVFPAAATGDITPTRMVGTATNDLTGIAVDSRGRDYILYIRSQSSGSVRVFAAGASGYPTPLIVVRDPALATVTGIAIDDQDNLLLAGYDLTSGQARIDTYSLGQHGPPRATLLRSLIGPHTGLLAATPNQYGDPTMSIAVNQATGVLFVFNAADVSAHARSQVSVFAARAQGDAPPLRVIGGAATGLAGIGILGTNKVAVAADGRLFVAQPNNTILVFGPGASGNIAPAQVIADATPGAQGQTEGGIAVR